MGFIKIQQLKIRILTSLTEVSEQRVEMNSFFFKNMLPSSSNNKTHEQEQSDFQRLIELCNSYGLNEQQTNQLISEFKKGSYKSGSNSLNQSMTSDQHDMSMSENGDLSQHHYNQSQTSQMSHPNKHQNHYYQQPHYAESQISNQYYGYENEEEDKHDESYNEMTFNEQNSMMLNSHRFHDGQQFNLEPAKGNHLKQEISLPTKTNERHQDAKFSQNKALQRNNSHKQAKRPSNEHPRPTHPPNNSQPTRNFKQPITNKNQSQQNQKTQHNQKTSQLTSNYSENSIHSHDLDNEPLNGLNPQYVKALIRNFELLETQNQTLKQQNASLQQKFQTLVKQHEIIKRQNDNIHHELQNFKNQSKFSNNQTAKFQALYEAETQKNQMLLNLKQKDSELIRGLKDSLLQLTELIKEKDTQNNELQQRLFSMYENLQNRGSAKYVGSQMGGTEFDQTGGSAQTYFGKSFSKKSLLSSESEKSLKAQGEQDSRERKSNYGRRDLTEMSGNNISLPPNNRAQESKQLARQPSACRLKACSNEEGSYKKPLGGQSREQGRQSKQNVFAPVQVQPAIKRNVQMMKASEEDKKRPGSRVDIKKYKGMIEELRNSYSNVGNGSQAMR